MSFQTILSEYPLRDALLSVMIDNKWSDFYYTVGAFPSIKLGGVITPIKDGMTEITQQEAENFAKSLVNEDQYQKLLTTKNLDFAFSFQNSRFRGNLSFQMGSHMVILRLLSGDMPTLQGLWLPRVYEDIVKVGQWLVLVTGPTGSGKSTTLAALINEINSRYYKHIITIEDPIEYIHPHKLSIVEQKDIGQDVPDYTTALMGAMRQTPDVILFWEMRTKNEIEMALKLAETWHLVFSTLHTRNAYQTITRIIDAFPGDQQNQIRVQLAEALVAVFSQRLLLKKDQYGVKMVKEILIRNAAVANLIRENELHQLPSVMQTGRTEGMQLLEHDLIDSVKFGEISLDEALKYANNPQMIRDGVQ